MTEALVHATCVVVEGVGLLLRGPSGSGKSDLALRLIELGWRLVADEPGDYQLGVRVGDEGYNKTVTVSSRAWARRFRYSAGARPSASLDGASKVSRRAPGTKAPC